MELSFSDDELLEIKQNIAVSWTAMVICLQKTY